jgi:probable addiction module antidote protein
MAVEFEPFDISEHLDSEEMIAGYLSAAAEDDDPNVLLGALLHAAKARGMMEVARAANLSRESLYKALRPGAHPRFATVQAVLRALGVKVTLSARASQARETQAAAVAGEDPLSALTSMVMQDEKFLAGLPSPPSIETIKALKAAGKAELALVDKVKPRTRLKAASKKAGGAKRRA